MDYGIDSNRTLELQDFVGIVYIPSMDYGIDSNRTLELQDLIDIQFNEISIELLFCVSKNHSAFLMIFFLVFTDFVSIPQTPLTRHCSNTTGLNPCMLTVGLYVV